MDEESGNRPSGDEPDGPEAPASDLGPILDLMRRELGRPLEALKSELDRVLDDRGGADPGSGGELDHVLAMRVVCDELIALTGPAADAGDEPPPPPR